MLHLKTFVFCIGWQILMTESSNNFKIASDLVTKLKNTSSQLHLRTYKEALNCISNDKDRREIENMVDVFLNIQQTNSSVVVLIHGIRTYAQWQELLKSELEKDAGTKKVYPLGYGYFDLICFWLPYYFFRWHRINKITQKLRNIQAEHPTENIIVVAHSFGTYIIADILSENPDIKIHRLLLCGSIIKNSFRWDKLPKIPRGGITNDCGTKDFYPILAKALSWGYGSSGRFGFKTNEVEDRYHDLDHSGFINSSFMKKFWIPFIVNGEHIPSDWNTKIPTPCLLLNLLNFLPIKSLLVVLVGIYYQDGLLEIFNKYLI